MCTVVDACEDSQMLYNRNKKEQTLRTICLLTFEKCFPLLQKEEQVERNNAINQEILSFFDLISNMDLIMEETKNRKAFRLSEIQERLHIYRLYWLDRGIFVSRKVRKKL